MSVDCIFADPHMHLWDFEEHANIHERRFLAGVRERALSSPLCIGGDYYTFQTMIVQQSNKIILFHALLKS
jgi:hypothetical protein